MRTRSLLARGITSAALFATATAVAAPDVRDHRPRDDRDHRDHRDHHDQPAPVAAGPTEAPPPPREEKFDARAGFVWVVGHWDWKAGKYDWVAGHWEREHAGKQWRPGHWDQQGTQWHYTDGAWADGAAAMPPPPPPVAPGEAPPPGGPGQGAPRVPDGRDHRREWTIDRPTVSSYWPVKGKVGTHIVIRGKNFPTDASVVWGSQPVLGAKITPDEIVVEVPAGAASGTLALHRERGRDLVVGTFEVAADFDADADAKRIDADRRSKAEAAWKVREKELAKDRAARKAAADKAEHEREETRDHRRQEREAQLRAKWEAAFLADGDTVAELTMHAERVANLTRMREVAELDSNGKLVVRIDIATTKETERHDHRMAALQDSFKTKGGAP